jgi:hypothetical protein
MWYLGFFSNFPGFSLLAKLLLYVEQCIDLYLIFEIYVGCVTLRDNIPYVYLDFFKNQIALM